MKNVLLQMVLQIVGAVSRCGVAVLSAILAVWHFISPVFGSHCRFYPTCSVYARGALSKHGLVKGAWLSSKRVCRCNSLFEGGIDPVP